MDGQGVVTQQDQQQHAQEEVAHSPSQALFPKKLKISRKIILVFAIGSIFILGVIVFFALKGDKTLFQLQQGLPQAQLEDTLKKGYKNPF